MKAIINLLLIFTLLIVPACSMLSPKPGVEWEASRYQSFKTVWISTLAMYDYQMDLRVQGKIKPEDAADIDAAWNLFRVGYRVALAEAQGNENMFTPDSVRKLADSVLTLIYAAQ